MEQIRITIDIKGKDILSIMVKPENAKGTRLCFNKEDAIVLLTRIKQMTQRDIGHFNSRFGKEGIGLGSVDVKWKEDKL